MKKVFNSLLVLVIILLICTSCQTNKSTTSIDIATIIPLVETTNFPDSTEELKITPEPTLEPTPTPTPTPELILKYKIADSGYYDEDEKTSIVNGVTYYNLFKNRIYYITPNELIIIPLEGNVSDWTIQEDKFNIIVSINIEEDFFILEVNNTGYIYLYNTELQKTVKIYSNLLAEQKEENKQKNKKLPYYLYCEKGSYSNFVAETITLTVYKVDSDGYYTIPYLTLSTACGTTAAKTPIGYFSIGAGEAGKFILSGREYWHDWGAAFGQYTIKYAEGLYLHGPTCKKVLESTVYSYYYNGIGQHVSGGCLRMQTGAIYWIWKNCPNGTILEIVDNNPRGTKIEIPEQLLADGYDPTDPYLLTREHHFLQ